MKYIIGLGNVLRGDDGIGSHIIQYIIDNKVDSHFIAHDFASDGWNILPLLAPETEKILMVDCMKMGKEIGSVGLFSYDFLINHRQLQKSYITTSHENNIFQLLNLAKQVGYPIPNITFMGVEGKDFNFVVSLSPVLLENISFYADYAINNINSS